MSSPTTPMEVVPVEYLASAGGRDARGAPVAVVTVRLATDIPPNGPDRAGALTPTNMLLDLRAANRLLEDLKVAIRQARLLGEGR